MADQRAAPGQSFTLTFPADTFADPDSGQSLTYTATGLPPGVTFDPTTRTLSGKPTYAGVYTITITTTDNGTPPASATASFSVAVSAQPPPTPVTLTKVADLSGPNLTQWGLVEGPGTILYAWARTPDTNYLGAIYRINTDGSGFAPIHTFAGTADEGDGPGALLLGSNGLLYGITADSQAKTHGHIFALAPDSGAYSVIKRFDVAVDGTTGPFDLMEGSDQALYGVTGPAGTALGKPILFKIQKDGNGFQNLHQFAGYVQTPSGFTRESPLAAPVEGPDHKLYGLVGGGGTDGLGTIYRINLDGTEFETIHNFKGNGEGAGGVGTLHYASDGFFYGVANNGGAGNQPAIYRLKPDGSAYQVVITANVSGLTDDQVIEGGDGYLYGTSYHGGQFVSGSVFRVLRDGTGYELLHEFSLLNNPPMGIQPTAPLQARDGYLYFITSQQVYFSVTPPQWQALLLRLGPVPLLAASQPPLTIKPQFGSVNQPGQFTLSFTGQSGQGYNIQASDSVPANWQDVQKVTADSQGNATFTDPSVVSRQTRFFRVKAE